MVSAPGPSSRGYAPGAGLTFIAAPPTPPSRDAGDACGVRGDTGRSAAAAGRRRCGRRRPRGHPCGTYRFLAFPKRRLPSRRPEEEGRRLCLCGRGPPWAALAGPAGEAVEVSAVLPGRARGRRLPRLAPGAGLRSQSRAVGATAAAVAFFSCGAVVGLRREEGLGPSSCSVLRG